MAEKREVFSLRQDEGPLDAGMNGVLLKRRDTRMAECLLIR